MRSVYVLVVSVLDWVVTGQLLWDVVRMCLWRGDSDECVFSFCVFGCLCVSCLG